MHKLEITSAIRTEAGILANLFIKKRGGEGGSANKIGMTFDCLYNGYIGELCFRDYLEFLGKQYQYHAMVPGVMDPGDFTMYTKDGGFLFVDVKTASKPEHKMLMVPETQFERKIYDLYVGLKLNGNLCEIWGCCNAAQLTQRMVDVMTMLRPLDQLTPIENLLDDLRDK